MRIIVVILYCLGLGETIVVQSYTCSNFSKSIRHDFYPLKHCQRSNKTIIGVYNFANVNECAKVARNHQALAFNFAPLTRGAKNRYENNRPNDTKTKFQSNAFGKIYIEEPEEFFNCQLLSCPEVANFSTMINDTRYDYYSLYTNPPPAINSTCIPSVGIFHFYQNFVNYLNASHTCNQSNGLLAHILSETRTRKISQFLNESSIPISVAFVGLNETRSHEKFMTSTREPIDCFRYRAWAPGHPKTSKKYSGCVAITNAQSWKMYNCNKRLPFICEIFTSKPKKILDLERKCPRKAVKT